MWSNNIKKYSKLYRVLAIDIIGECGKSAENRPNFKSNHYSNWLIDIFRELYITEASIIGCSLGGWIALDFAINHRNKVKNLALIASAGISPIKVSTIIWIMISSVAGKWGFNKINKMVYGNLKLDNQTQKFIQLAKKYFSPRTDVLPLFSDKELQKIKKPVFFVGGDNDCFYSSFKTAERLEKNTDKLKCKIQKNTGHVILNSSNEILTFLENNINEKQ